MTAPERVDVVVVGGGQAGLAAAWHLSRHGLRYVVLEAAAELGHSWRMRWASLRLFTPAEHDALPGMPFPAPPGSSALLGFVADDAAHVVGIAAQHAELGAVPTVPPPRGTDRADGPRRRRRPKAVQG